MQVKNGTHWLYVGGETGYNLVHMIVLVEEDKKDPKMPRIMTYSLYDQEDESLPGFVWYGPMNLFLKAFKYLGPPDESAA